MPNTRASVALANPSVQLKKLCRHFSHKIEASFDDYRGELAFPYGQATLVADDEALHMHGEGGDADALDRLEAVLANHLTRFAARELRTNESLNGETLSIDWQRSV